MLQKSIDVGVTSRCSRGQCCMSRENAVYVSLLLRVTCCKMAVLYVTRETSHKRARFFVRIISNVALEHRYKKVFLSVSLLMDVSVKCLDDLMMSLLKLTRNVYIFIIVLLSFINVYNSMIFC